MIYNHSSLVETVDTDLLIDCCLMSSGKYFMHIQEENKLNNEYVDCVQGSGKGRTFRVPLEKLQVG